MKIYPQILHECKAENSVVYKKMTLAESRSTISLRYCPLAIAFCTHIHDTPVSQAARHTHSPHEGGTAGYMITLALDPESN